MGLRIRISQLFCLFFTFSELLAVTVLYHFENDTVVLPCEQLSNEQIVWQGPEKYSTYGYGDIINPKFSKSNRLTIIHVNGSPHYNLQIRRFSSEDEGNYKCVRGSGGDEFFTLTIGTYPRNLTIGEEDSQHIVYGYLNHVLDLHCSVVHGIPNGKLMWMVHNQTLEEKTTASLVYSFKPKQQDHLQNYTCATKSDISQYYMERTVQLFVFMPPVVLISLNKTLGITEGEDLTLYCNYSSNHEVKELKWEEMFQHKSPLDERSQYLTIKSINRQHAGKYRCTVINMAGSASDIVTIEVYYPPTVLVTFEDHGNYRQLNCEAHGVPDQYIYKQWEHRSDYSDLIRYLPDDGSGRLILPNTTGETDRHHDRGLYICHASNNVSLNGSNSFVRGEFFLKAQGKPYFVTSNNNTQYGIKGQVGNLTVDFVSYPEITIFTVIGEDKIHCNDNYTLETWRLMDKVYNNTVTVNGSRLVISMNIENKHDFRSYTITLRNKFGLANFSIYFRLRQLLYNYIKLEETL
ncbi:hemicentin-1-like [Mytilus trossulus]|uniref:hemicentin-1-like n=1 Tax=Mytilus trossulus TaxID=6551 RepID=UPI003006B679